MSRLLGELEKEMKLEGLGFRTAGGERRRRRSALIQTCLAVSVSAVLFLGFLDFEAQNVAASGLTLHPSSWTAGCDGVASGAHYLSAPFDGAASTSDWSPDVHSGGAGLFITDSSIDVGVNDFSQSSQYFFLGPSSSSGCYYPSSSRSVTVTYTYTVDISGWSDEFCQDGGSYSYLALIYLLGNIHGPSAFVQSSHTQGDTIRITGSYSCPALSPHMNVGDMAAQGSNPQTWSVTTASDALTGGTGYDFFSSMVTDMWANTTASNDVEVMSLNMTTSLTSISCPAC